MMKTVCPKMGRAVKASNPAFGTSLLKRLEGAVLKPSWRIVRGPSFFLDGLAQGEIGSTRLDGAPGGAAGGLVFGKGGVE
jgi:hypothetical protein